MAYVIYETYVIYVIDVMMWLRGTIDSLSSLNSLSSLDSLNSLIGVGRAAGSVGFLIFGGGHAGFALEEVAKSWLAGEVEAVGNLAD